MKRYILVVLVLIMVFSLFFVSRVLAEASNEDFIYSSLRDVSSEDRPVNLYINNKIYPVPSDYGRLFIDKNNRTMIPLRFISEVLKYEVDWDGENHKAIIRNEDKLIEISLGARNVKINKSAIMMDTEAIMVKDRVYVPIRYVVEGLDKLVKYKRYTEQHKIELISKDGRDIDIKGIETNKLSGNPYFDETTFDFIVANKDYEISKNNVNWQDLGLDTNPVFKLDIGPKSLSISLGNIENNMPRDLEYWIEFKNQGSRFNKYRTEGKAIVDSTTRRKYNGEDEINLINISDSRKYELNRDKLISNFINGESIIIKTYFKNNDKILERTFTFFINSEKFQPNI